MLLCVDGLKYIVFTVAQRDGPNQKKNIYVKIGIILKCNLNRACPVTITAMWVHSPGAWWQASAACCYEDLMDLFSYITKICPTAVVH
jgi:hypothetical protein